MMGMREHIHRLDLRHRIAGIQQIEVPCLRGWVAAYIDHGRGFHLQYLFDELLMHARPWRVGNDRIGTAMGGEKIVIADRGHIPGRKAGMPDTIHCRIFPGVFDGLGDDLYAYDLRSQAAYKNTDAAGAAVEIIDRLFPAELCEIPRYLV